MNKYFKLGLIFICGGISFIYKYNKGKKLDIKKFLKNMEIDE